MVMMMMMMMANDLRATPTLVITAVATTAEEEGARLHLDGQLDRILVFLLLILVFFGSLSLSKVGVGLYLGRGNEGHGSSLPSLPTSLIISTIRCVVVVGGEEGDWFLLQPHGQMIVRMMGVVVVHCGRGW